MGKLRVHELAKKLGLENKELLEKLKNTGIDAKTHSSTVDEAEVMKALNAGQTAPPPPPSRSSIVRRPSSPAAEPEAVVERAPERPIERAPEKFIERNATVVRRPDPTPPVVVAPVQPVRIEPARVEPARVEAAAPSGRLEARRGIELTGDDAGGAPEKRDQHHRCDGARVGQ